MQRDEQNDGATAVAEMTTPAADYASDASDAPMPALPPLTEGITAVREGRLEAAEELCRAYMERDALPAQARTLLARVLLQSGRTDEALRLAHAATRIDPDDADAFAAFAEALRTMGEAEHACAVLRHATLVASDRAELHLLLAQTQMDVGRFAASAQAALRALQLQPDLLVGYQALSDALAAQGRIDDAVQARMTMVSLAPDDATLHLRVGNWCRTAGALREALACFETLSRLMPDDPAGFVNAGVVYRMMGRPQEAVAQHRAAIAVAPEHPSGHMNLGLALRDIGRADEAIAALRCAVERDVDNATAWYNLGSTLLAAQHTEIAVEALRQATALAPDFSQAFGNLGLALQTRGDLDGAEKAWRQATRIDPTIARNWLNLARLGRLEDPTALECLLQSPQTSASDRADLHLAAGLVYDRAGHARDAFAHVTKGNALVPASFDAERLDAMVARMIEVFEGDVWMDAAGDASGSQPIFVVGLPRSGTSLVEQMLSRHAEIYGAGERQEIEECANAALRAFAGGRPYPDFVPDLDAAQARMLADAYSLKMHQLSDGAPWVVDKMPANFLHLGFIATLFPNARVIHCRRHPLDVALSNYMQRYQPGAMQWTYALDTIACYMNAHHRLMAHLERVLPMPILHVDYEALVADPETQARRMLQHIGLPWDARVAAPEGASRDVFTASSAQVRRPIHQRSVGRWMRYGSQLQSLIDQLEMPISGRDEAVEAA